MAVAAVSAAVAALVTVPPDRVGAATGDEVMGPGRTVLVSGSGDSETPDPLATSAAVSADGSTVAYAAEQEAVEGPSSYGIVVRDLGLPPDRGGVRVGNLDFPSSAPSLDGTGDRLVFLTDLGSTRTVSGEHSDVDVRLRDLRGEGNNETLTGTDDDLTYQRTLWCAPEVGNGYDPSPADRCGPQLSADGRAVAWPARLSVVASRLHESVDGTKDPPTYLTPGEDSALAALDFGRDSSRLDLLVRVSGNDAITFDRAAVTRGEDAFAVVPSDTSVPECAGSTIGGSSESDTCVVTVRFLPRPSPCGPLFGRLVLDSANVRGRTAVNLVGDDYTGCFGAGRRPATHPSTRPSTARAEGCATPDIADFGPRSDGSESLVETASVGEQLLGSTGLVATQVTNTDVLDRRVHFTADGCELRLYTPTIFGPSNDACVEGQTLRPKGTCTAYVAFTPTAVGPSAASLALTNDIQPPQHLYRFVGTGGQDLVLLRRDADGNGSFLDDGPPEVVSVASDGQRVDGRTPSLSADGRTVAFVSDAFADGSDQVLVHDTRRTGKPGSTVLASRESPGPGGLHDTATQPSLSGDGQRIAYTASDFEANTESYDTQVLVRDLVDGRTVVASSPAGSTAGGRDPSWSPVLSRDASTVVFVSDSTDLLPEGAETCCPTVHARDLTSELATPAAAGPGPLPVSLRPERDLLDEPAGLPAVDGDGGVVAFQTSDALTSEAAPYDSVYVRVRGRVLTVDPGSVDFGIQQVGTVGTPREVTVTNQGVSTARVELETIDSREETGPFQVDGCADPLPPGGSCTVTVAFAPVVRDDEVVASLIAFVDPGAAAYDELAPSAAVDLTGIAVPAVVTLVPAALDFPETNLGIASRPLRLRVTNVLEIPLALDGVITAGVRDFRVTPAPRCADLTAGATCVLRVEFEPLGLGTRAGVLQLVSTVDGIGYTQDVPLTGSTTDPEVVLSPAVAHEGRVTFVEGTHFAPGVPVLLTWSSGPVASSTVVPDETGSFSAPVIVLAGGGSGPRGLSVTVPGLTDLLAPPPGSPGESPSESPTGSPAGPVPTDVVGVDAEVLVVPGSLQPPDFVSRN